jgi:hypothetical protein
MLLVKIFQVSTCILWTVSAQKSKNLGVTAAGMLIKPLSSNLRQVISLVKSLTPVSSLG